MRLLLKTKLLFGLFFILLVANLIDGNQQNEFDELPSLPAMLKDDINKIEISTATDKVILENKDGVWMMTAPFETKADRSRIKSLILNFRKAIPMDALIDTNEEEKYGLDAGNAIIIELWTSGAAATASFLVGNDAAHGSSFVRLSGSDSIYRARVGGRRRYDLSATDWQNQQVFDVNLEDFTSLTVRMANNEAYQVVRENGWKLLPAQNEDLNEDRIDRAIKSLVMLRIGERVEQTSFTPAVIFELSDINGQKLIAQSSLPEDGAAFLKLEGKDEVYKVASPAIERFLQGASWFVDRRVIKLNTRAEIDMIGFKTVAQEIVLQQDLSTGFWNVVKPKNIDLDMREIFFMANTLASLEAEKKIVSSEQYEAYFERPAVTVSILTLMGAVTSIEISELIEVDGVKGYLCRDKEQQTMFLISPESAETIVTGFGQADFFTK